MQTVRCPQNQQQVTVVVVEVRRTSIATEVIPLVIMVSKVICVDFI